MVHKSVVPRLKAAVYMRASTEFQNYSIENQTACISNYAAQHDIDIIQTYRDDGQSGLTLKKRPALKTLLSDIEKSFHDFEVLLVYDVSRWGRFQDVDESAYYEFTCRKNGIAVEYCAEPFRNDGTSMSAIMKNMKRVMAAEYSRELSAKVFHGQVNMIKRGYMHGGAHGYGFRRMLVDKNNNHKQILERGQRKSINTDRTVLVLGPQKEIDTVREIYRLYVEQGAVLAEIARSLILRDKGSARWTVDIIKGILFDQKYIGNTVFNRASNKLQRGTTPNPPGDWIICKATHPAIVEEKTFWQAHEVRKQKHLPPTDEQMLAKLKEVYNAHGKVTARLIDEKYGKSSYIPYYKRFGSLLLAYKLINYKPDAGRKSVTARSLVFNRLLEAANEMLAHFAKLGISAEFRPDFVLRIGGNIDIALRVVPAFLRSGKPHWRAYFDPKARYDFGIIVRLEHCSTDILDYYIFNEFDLVPKQIHFSYRNGPDLDCRRHDSLDEFYDMLCRILKISDPYEAPVLISKSEALAITNMSDDRISVKVNAGKFPKPIRLGNHYAAWIKSEVELWRRIHSNLPR